MRKIIFGVFLFPIALLSLALFWITGVLSLAWDAAFGFTPPPEKTDDFTP